MSLFITKNPIKACFIHIVMSNVSCYTLIMTNITVRSIFVCLFNLRYKDVNNHLFSVNVI